MKTPREVQTAPHQRERTLGSAVGLTKAAASAFTNAPLAKTARIVAIVCPVPVLPLYIGSVKCVCSWHEVPS